VSLLSTPRSQRMPRYQEASALNAALRAFCGYRPHLFPHVVCMRTCDISGEYPRLLLRPKNVSPVQRCIPSSVAQEIRRYVTPCDQPVRVRAVQLDGLGTVGPIWLGKS
jgi:hypothetical protein